MSIKRDTPNQPVVVTVIWLMACGVGLPSALAQNALGNGRALDANLQRGSGGVNPQGRAGGVVSGNDLVTGNVGGLGYFRDEVGYGAAGAFGGELSDDDLFRFRAMSLSSTPSQVPGGGYTLGMAQGQAGVYRSHTRTGVGDLGRQMSTGDDRWRSDIATYGLSGLVVKSSSGGDGFPLGVRVSSDVDSSRFDERIGLVNQAEGRLLEVRVSPLFGVRYRQVENAFDRSGVSGRAENATDQEVVDPNAPATQDRSFRGLPAVELGRQLQNRAQEQPSETRPASDELVNDIEAGLFQPMEEGVSVEGENVYLDLLSQIKKEPRRIEDTKGHAESDRPSPDDGRSGQPEGLSETDSTDPLESLLARLDYDLSPVATLAGKKNTTINQLMRQAQDEITAGQYLDAHEHYRHVIQLRPDNPMAYVGLLHAQIGAGMNRSAQINLRRLFERYPELIAARYNASLLPSADRLRWVSDELIKTMEAIDQAGPALLMAYIGYQGGSRKLVRFGLDAAQTRSPRDPLIAILRRIWLEQGTASGDNPTE